MFHHPIKKRFYPKSKRLYYCLLTFVSIITNPMNIKIKNYLFSALLLLAFSVANGQGDELPKNWFNLDLEKDSILGVSTERAYEALQGRESKTVIVAVIDDGTDFNHEDLKDIIWTNEKEIPGNGIDDDNNGYIDDIHGWNFIGGKNGDVKEDTYEATRLFSEFKKKFDDVEVNKLSKEDKKEYDYYTNKVKPFFLEQYYDANNSYNRIKAILDAMDAVLANINGEVTEEKLEAYKPQNTDEEIAVKNMVAFMGYGLTVDDVKAQFTGGLDHYKTMVEKSLNTSFNPRPIVGDKYADASERNYGNNHYLGPNGDHGSHVAGIIAAIRNNGVGVNGVANNVKIMIIRVVPDGDERDKDVANGIRYAADNGALVVNMSFGKAFKYNKQVVDEAVKYAATKDVLLVHAAGNDAKNTDVEDNFPTDAFEKGGVAKNWIEVGASAHIYGENIPAVFSNYAKKNVDVFAPGVDIESTIPNNKYAEFSGTSMASPVTAGVCALIRSYFPELTAEQVKAIVMKTVTPVKVKVLKPGTKDLVKFKELCISGGVVNTYQAVLLAMKTKGKKK
jgi:cell wall-associated protease